MKHMIKSVIAMVKQMMSEKADIPGHGEDFDVKELTAADPKLLSLLLPEAF